MGRIPPNIRLRSEPMDPDNSLWSWATSSRSASGTQCKYARALMARWKLLGRVVPATSAPIRPVPSPCMSSEHRVPLRATMGYGHGPTRATEYRKVPLVPPQSCTSPSATALHRACSGMLPSAAAHHGDAWPKPPSAHTSAIQRALLRSAELHRVAPSGTELRGLRATPVIILCIEWRPVLKCYRAPPGAASHASQRRSALAHLRATERQRAVSLRDAACRMPPRSTACR